MKLRYVFNMPSELFDSEAATPSGRTLSNDNGAFDRKNSPQIFGQTQSSIAPAQP
jgi:hypothetical protein